MCRIIIYLKYFYILMSRKNLFVVIPVLALALLLLFGGKAEKPLPHFEEKVKVALRKTGHKLLLASQDSTSLVLPIQKLEENKFRLSFETDLVLAPEQVVSEIKAHLVQSGLTNDYIVELIDCDTQNVWYSFQMVQDQKDDLVACQGRTLPLNCYALDIVFLKPQPTHAIGTPKTYLSLMLIGFLGFGLWYTNQKKPREDKQKLQTKNTLTLGPYQLDCDNLLLLGGAQPIDLSAKESELLAIFSRHGEQVVKREILVKEVWEDKGIFVGRSLDTFISMIRKKLKPDGLLQIVTVHGVGYRMESKQG